MTWVLFDYGLVLSRPPTTQDEAAMADAAGAPRSVFLEQYWKWRAAYDRADLDAGQYWRAVASGLGTTLDDAAIADLIRLDAQSWLHLRDGTVALVEDLAAAGHQLALLSNAPVEVAAAIRGLPVMARFRHLVFSCDLKVSKPEPACFRRCLDKLGATAGEVVFLDDRSENVAAAGALGMRSVLFSDPDQARAAVVPLLAGDIGGPRDQPAG